MGRSQPADPVDAAERPRQVNDPWVFNAWIYYCWSLTRILHQSEADGTALKTSRGTQNVLRITLKWPLAGGHRNRGAVVGERRNGK
ncbi:hypothetical protein SNK04_014037 [Fusarium graminearum]